VFLKPLTVSRASVKEEGMLTVSGFCGTVCCIPWAISTILVSEEKRVIHVVIQEITVGMIPRPKATVWIDSGFLVFVLLVVILE
jgi:hypothetical protein